MLKMYARCRWGALLCATSLLLAACGDDDNSTDQTNNALADTGADVSADAGFDTGADAQNDAGADTGPDVGSDAGADVGPDTSPDVAPSALEIEGTWVSNYGMVETITSDGWNDDAVIEYDNAENSAITQTADTAEYNPGKFNKIVWTELADSSFWYCTVDFGLDTAEAARTTDKTADATDPANGGCGGFSWTKLSVPIEVVGVYDTQFDSTETITPLDWNANPISEWNNADNWAVTYTPETAEYNPDSYSKLVWTEPDASGSFYYCIVDFGLETVEAAKTTDKTADASDPANGGCGGFSWTEMTPAP